MPDHVLLLGGTEEALALADRLCSTGAKVTTSLAGRTSDPKVPAGDLRIGGFGGVSGMVEWCKKNHVTRIVDATHPFAGKISKNARLAAEELEIPIETQTREPWQSEVGDNWIMVANEEEAASVLPDSARVLLALGSQHIMPFERRKNIFFLIRMINAPAADIGVENHRLLLAPPAPLVAEEARLLQEWEITHIVCRNSGGKGSYAKIEAARMLKIPVVMIEHPRLS